MSFEEYASVSEEAARRLNVSADIHPDDFIFRFLFNNPSFKSKEASVEYYFNDGCGSANKLLGILKDVCGYDGSQGISLLEFASGYGCVTRHLKNVVPFAATTSCDIHEEAVRFVREKLGVDAVLSASRPEDLRLDRKFDVVFALSFFSHMPKTSSARWMRQLASFVKPGGYLVFTTHGLKSIKNFPDCVLDEDGFFFRPRSEQKDLDTQEYGQALALPQYFLARAFEMPDVMLASFQEGFWWKHQDVFVFRRLQGTEETGQPAGVFKVRKRLGWVKRLIKGR